MNRRNVKSEKWKTKRIRKILTNEFHVSSLQTITARKTTTTK